MASNSKLVIRIGDRRITATTSDNEISAALVSEDLSLRTIEGFKQWLEEKVPRLRSRGDFELFGWHLYDFLFRGDIATEFQTQYVLASRIPVPLRLELHIEPTEATLASVPWEFLYCPPKGSSKQGFFMSTHTSLTFLRTNSLLGTSPSVLIKEPPRILIITTRPPGFAPPLWRSVAESVTAEVRKIEGAEVKVEVDPVNLAAIEKALAWKPHILQFIGHGTQDGKEGRLALLRDNPWWVTGTELLELLDRLALGWRPRLIVLHACEGGKVARHELALKFGFGGIAPMLLAGKVPAVVAMQYEMDQRSAIDFSLQLYSDLFKNCAIQQAVQSARSALMIPYMRTEGDPLPRPPRAFGTPVLYMSQIDGVLFPRAVDAEATRDQLAKGDAIPSGQTVARTEKTATVAELGAATAAAPFSAAGLGDKRGSRDGLG